VRRPLTRHVAVGAVRAADGDDDVNLNDEGSAGQDPRKMTGAELVQQDPRLAEVVRRLAYEALRGTGIAADVLVSTRSRFERRARVVASLPASVLREGKLVHAA